MEKERVRIADIAEELGVSTATVSNVIHGKTKKISAQTVERVQELLEKRQYIPSMAGILLAQNNSRIIGVVINDHEKYEGHTLEDGFIASSVNALTGEVDREGYFLMLKVTKNWSEIPKFASMWNMEGMVLIGFCEQDYRNLRAQMHIPFVVYDGYFEKGSGLANIAADHFDGGVKAGTYLKEKGHRCALCLADNEIFMDRERFMGLKSVLPESRLLMIPMEYDTRQAFYKEHLPEISEYTAVFAVSDYYAIDFIRYLKRAGLSVPGDMSVIGFDDVKESALSDPPLTTIRQDNRERARLALETVKRLKELPDSGENIRLPVELIERGSVRIVEN